MAKTDRSSYGEVTPEEHAFLVHRMKQIEKSPDWIRLYGHLSLEDFVEMMKDEFHGVDPSKRH